MIFDQSKKSDRIALGVVIVVIFLIVRAVYQKNSERDLKKKQDIYIQNKNQTNSEQQIYDEIDTEGTQEPTRVSMEQTNFTELFELYLYENELLVDLFVKEEEGTLSTYEVDLLEELSIEMFKKTFDNEKIRLNSTNELFSGIMYIAENGQVFQELSLKNGKLNGRLKSYYDSGEILSESIWENGKRISLKCWDTDGNLEEC